MGDVCSTHVHRQAGANLQNINDRLFRDQYVSEHLLDRVRADRAHSGENRSGGDMRYPDGPAPA